MDPRFPSIGRYPTIVNVGDQAMEAYHERSAPLREIAYARTGRAPPEPVESEPAEPEAPAGPTESTEVEPQRPYNRGILSSVGRGISAGASAFRPGEAIGYGAAMGISALGSAITGVSSGALKYLMQSPMEEEMEDLPHELHEPIPAPPQQPVPPYLLDREEAPARKKKFIDKERTRIREQAAMTGEHPFHPWRGGAG